jgi:hypothetical protein
MIEAQMGPNLRTWLRSLPEGLGTEDIEPLDIVRKIEANLLSDRKLLEELVDELVSMKMPLLALALVDHNGDLWDRGSYRSCHTEGIAAILCGELERAESCFLKAQRVDSTEPASYTNLIQIFTENKRWEEAEIWAKSGIKAVKDHGPLWDVIGRFFFAKERDSAPGEVLKLGTSSGSWYGELLGVVLQGGSELAQLDVMERYYGRGERSEEFLVEYTGLLGQLEEYKKISPVVWQSQSSFEKIPWKLAMHDLQAKLALSEEKQFLESADILLKREDIPESARQDLENLRQEVML